jgi:cystinosin
MAGLYDSEIDGSGGSSSKLYRLLFTGVGSALAGTFFVLGLGAGLGFAFPPGGAYPAPWDTVSGVIGWIYFVAWSVSFWPQIVLNQRRKSVAGLSFDFAVLNILGFACYTTFNVALFWSSDVRAAYAQAHDGSLPPVQSNDVFFALHALACTVIVGLQILFLDRAGQRMSVLASLAIAGCLVAIAVYAALAATNTEGRDWLSFFTFLSYVKLGISLSKYIPQVVMNYRRKSTEGWSIENIMLDLTGGLLSIAQLCMDCAVLNDWSGIVGDAVKFGLGFVSIFFDLIFLVQHYCLYARKRGGGYQTLPANAGYGYPQDHDPAPTSPSFYSSVAVELGVHRSKR